MTGFTPEDGPRQSVHDRLFEHRIVVVSGVLDDAACSELVAKLLTLDALGDESISLRLTSEGGSTDGCLGVVDVLDSLGVPVRATAVGRVEGAPVAVLAAATHRSCGPHTTFVLREEESSFSGPARLLETFAAEQARRHLACAEVIARRAPHDGGRVAADMTSRVRLDAEGALAYGIVDQISDSDSSVIRLPGSWQSASFGFGPPPTRA